jgi:hypothetical protein
VTDPDDLSEAIDAFGEGLFREVAERAGRIAIQKVEALGIPHTAVTQLDNEIQRDILRASFVEALSELLPDKSLAEIETGIDDMLTLLAMEGASNADGGTTRQ